MNLLSFYDGINDNSKMEKKNTIQVLTTLINKIQSIWPKKHLLLKTHKIP